MPEIAADYGINYVFGGDASNQEASVGDLALALPLSIVTGKE